jgi:membrane associated rhomboid family serine protease
LLPIKDNIPTDRVPFVTIALILANVIVYLFLQKHTGGVFSAVDDENTTRWGAIPYEFTHWGKHCDLVAGGQAVACEGQAGVSGTADPQPATIVTAFSSMFMHGSILHIGGNMLFLWIFGNNVEDSMGRVRFIAFYLLGGFAALAGQILVGPNAAVPTIGASGAVAAVLGGYLLLYPRARVITLIFIIFFITIVELPAIFLLGFWFLQQIFFGAADLTDPTGHGGGVAYFAHVGGFVFGLALIRAFAQRYKPVPPRFPVY